MTMKKLKASDIITEKNYQGAWVCSAIIDGVRLHRQYYGYTKKYAKAHFKNNPPK